MRVPLPLTILAAIALAACAGTSPTTAPTQKPATTGTAAGATATAAATTAAAATTPAAAAITCGATGSGSAVAIDGFKFTPAATNVSSGGFVTWTNSDPTTHTVTFDNGPDCGQLGNGATVTAKFNAPGTYAYHCAIHSSMKGTVTVSG